MTKEALALAAVEAGWAIMECYNRDFEVYEKEDKSPLTEADIASHHVIMRHLEPTGLPVLSEEGKEMPYEERSSWTDFWVVDPLDGTKEFLKRNGEFTVNIALVKGNYPVEGIIYAPVLGELYYTDQGKSWKMTEVFRPEDLATGWDRVEQIRVSEPEGGVIRIVGSRSHMNDDTTNYVEELKNQFEQVEITSKGSSLKFCLVAAGITHEYPRFAPTMEWDTAAGQAIVEAAGKQVIDRSTGERMAYNKMKLLNNYFLVR
ncbi:3'(2'),5'-bisphosphate nucleotidase CysQ [bacterium SCSIO 12741]|nr:3'(2'),5'-bisphosphate nucleotidase CysQ [bacterium SCSIO 12741]